MDRLSAVPEGPQVEYTTVRNAVGLVQSLGCWGMSQHQIRDENHRLALAALRWAVRHWGCEVDLFRGVRDDFPDSQHLILFGTPDLEVARFYGPDIKHYRVRALHTQSNCVPVASADPGHMDIEYIFFHNAGGNSWAG
ncbi:hypothetical protein [Gloeobacter morelensis]|uniref:hypothetical protein n=1 Tax=Gloeobacter morelensis TaxID=2907343 RepID=UPI001E2B2D5C|nr:hypothetical protein [Gloeobacter morelensis]UFP97273.1 hypothetical protein ISF26_24435 [Gloeobacter morelensis MG652769]